MQALTSPFNSMFPSLDECRDGISHSPLEYVSPEDVAAATATLYQYLRKELLAKPAPAEGEAATAEA